MTTLQVPAEPAEENNVPLEIKKDNRFAWAEFIGSSFLFASAYLLLYLLYDLVTALTAAYFGLEPVMFYDTTRFGNNAGWYPHCVKRTYLIGAIVMAFSGVMLYVLYLFFRKSYIFVRLFFLWGSLVSFSILAQRMIGIPFAGNFEYRLLDSLGLELAIFTSYMFYKDSTEWAIAFLGVVLIVLIGILYAKPFLQTAWSSRQIGSQLERYRYLRRQVLLPALAGSVLVTIMVFPSNIIPNFMSFSVALLILSVMTIHAMLMGAFKVKRQKDWERWPIVPSVVFVLIFVLIRTVLSSGIRIPAIALF